jgi:hypothetical protein
MAFFLDRSQSAVVSEQVLERAPRTDPTHGVFVNDSFYYIANSGWGVLDGHGTVRRLVKIESRSFGSEMH